MLGYQTCPPDSTDSPIQKQVMCFPKADWTLVLFLLYNMINGGLVGEYEAFVYTRCGWSLCTRVWACLLCATHVEQTSPVCTEYRSKTRPCGYRIYDEVTIFTGIVLAINTSAYWLKMETFGAVLLQVDGYSKSSMAGCKWWVTITATLANGEFYHHSVSLNDISKKYIFIRYLNSHQEGTLSIMCISKIKFQTCFIMYTPNVSNKIATIWWCMCRGVLSHPLICFTFVWFYL